VNYLKKIKNWFQNHKEASKLARMNVKLELELVHVKRAYEHLNIVHTRTKIALVNLRYKDLIEQAKEDQNNESWWHRGEDKPLKVTIKGMKGSPGKKGKPRVDKIDEYDLKIEIEELVPLVKERKK